jgi:predicted adenine nucleotide alpha hydrolase (AANH) superfamily ATPase
MKMLLHTCCGPCSIYPIEYLKEKGMEIQGYFYNPNIHPYTEYVKRRDTLLEYAAGIGIPVICEEDYPMEEFIRKVVHRESERCRECYAMRLEETAKAAKGGGFDSFTTTLLVSPYQKHELIRTIGEEYGQKYGVPFYYVDFRPGYRKATARSRELGMYRQKFCGCIYSEKERYFHQPKKGGLKTQK